MIELKPIKSGQYWVAKQDEKKIGALTKQDGNYILAITGFEDIVFKSLKDLQRSVDVKFTVVKRSEVKKDVFGFDAETDGGAPVNPSWEVELGIPTYQKSRRSSTTFAAGWYRIYYPRKVQVVFCPRLMVLHRYRFDGPFKTEPSTMNELFTEAK